MKKSVKNYLYFASGGISLSLGIIGIILPILPTTPFLLLSSYCFVRSSKKANRWLLNHKVFGSYLRNYIEDKAIKKAVRTKAIILLWFSIIISVILIGKINVGVIIVMIASLVTYHLMKLKVL